MLSLAVYESEEIVKKTGLIVTDKESENSEDLDPNSLRCKVQIRCSKFCLVISTLI